MQDTIAFCLFNYFPHGGLQRDFLRVARLCQRPGQSIRVYTMSWTGPVPEGFDVRLVAARGLSNHARAARFALQVRRMLAAEPATRVVGFNKMAGLDVYFASDSCYAARVADKSFLYRMTGRCRSYLALERAVFGPEAKTHVLLITPRQVEEFQRHYGLENSRYTLLPPGLDDAFATPPDRAAARTRIRAEWGVAESDYLLLQVGSSFDTKGVDRAIRALAALPAPLRDRCLYLVAGSGKAQGYEGLARRLGVGGRVRFAGVRPDVPELMAGADLLVHPARVESAGMTLLESLASGLPVICSGVCGYAPYIAGAGAGIVLDEPFEQARLNRALETMLDPNTLARHRRDALAYCGRTRLTGLPQRAAELILERLP